MNRRTFLTSSTMAAVGLGLSGCAPQSKPNVSRRGIA
ncbi:MAG: hypothetical protein DMG01_20960 [Acidobacteria bacterium]|nr:MAG: hypothetical protein DMG01_20960 [Acidobacteriota bacterium]